MTQCCAQFRTQRMTVAEQLGAQIKAARGGMSLRMLSEQVGISASTLGEYERGVRVPEADKLAKIAEVLNCFTYQIDNFYFTVSRVVVNTEHPPNAQLPLDFSGEYGYAKANVKIGPKRISLMFDGFKAGNAKGQLVVSSN